MPHRPGHGRFSSDNSEADRINASRAMRSSGMDVGFGEGQVDPGLAAGVIQQQTGVSPQAARQAAQQSFNTGGGQSNQTDSGGTTVTTQTDDTPPGTKKDDRETGVTEEDGKKNYFIKGIGEVDAYLYGAYRQLIAAGVALPDVLDAIKLGMSERDFSDRNLKQLKDLSIGDFTLANFVKTAFEKPTYEHEFLGSAGAAAALNKLNKITDPKKKQEFVNRLIENDPDNFRDMFADQLGLGKGGVGNFDKSKLPTPEEFEKQLVGFNIGNKNFDKNYYGTQADFYKVNPFPATQGGLEELAGLAFGEDEFLNRQIAEARMLADKGRTGERFVVGQNVGGGSGGGGAQQNQDANTGGNLPDFGLVRQFRRDEGFTPNYTGGPEQIMLAGGYFNPSTQQFMYGGGPYGTSGLFQGDPMQFFNKGGFVDGRGLSGFKMKGF